MSINTPLQNPGIQEDTNTLQTWREDVFDSTIRIVGVLGSIAYFTGIFFAFKETPWGFLLAYTLVYLWVMVSSYIFRTKGWFRLHYWRYSSLDSCRISLYIFIHHTTTDQ